MIGRNRLVSTTGRGGRRFPSPFFLVVAFVLLAAACGDGSEAETTAELSWEDSPLQRALGRTFSDSDVAEEEIREQERQAQETIVQCMADAGFEYLPEDQNLGSFDDPMEQFADLSDLEFAQRFGWGASTQEDLFGFDSFDAEYEDPNQDYVGGLSPETQEAYFETLHGSGPEFDGDPSQMTEEELNAISESYEPTGCYNTAHDEIFNIGGEDRSIFEELDSEFESLWERTESDPRIVEFNREWASCVGEAGYSYSDVDEAQQALWERTDELYNSASFPGEGLTQEDHEAMSEEELEAIYSQPPEFDEELRAEIQADEIAFAVASLECGRPPPLRGGPDIVLEVRFELEKQFIAEHQDVFDRYAEDTG